MGNITQLKQQKNFKNMHRPVIFFSASP